MNNGKIIILSAPSGTGKSSIIKELMPDRALNLGFSISCTSRPPRGDEKDGQDYYFITDEDFKERIAKGMFVEWEEVYEGTHYGTLTSEVDRITDDEGKNLIMDIDVKGGINVKRQFGSRALSIFIMPPSIEELEKRLRGRATDNEEKIRQRLAKAEYEITFAGDFDMVVVNDSLPEAVEKVKEAILSFIKE